MSWAELANQTAAIVQLSVWTHDVMRGAPLQQQNIASFLLVALRVDVPVRCFCHSGCLHIQDLIAGPGSIGIMLNTAAVWQWGMKAESRAAGWARVTFCMRLLCYSKSCTQSLECHDNVVKLLIHKTGFECPEKATLKLELRREPWSLRPHPAGKGSWPRLSPEMLAPTLGFFLIHVSGIRRNSSHEHHGDLGFPACCVTLDDILFQPTRAHCGCMTWVSTVIPQSAAYSGFHWQHVGHGMCSSPGVLKCVPRLTDCNSVWPAFFLPAFNRLQTWTEHWHFQQKLSKAQHHFVIYR